MLKPLVSWLTNILFMAVLISVLGWFTHRMVQFDRDAAPNSPRVIPEASEMLDYRLHRERQNDLREQSLGRRQ
ncbi:MAG: hypothetical protein JWN70_1258 [Planctomycetaceae bacterium]|nr:hypothetical protein [Planctomycetaceae bacterium]